MKHYDFSKAKKIILASSISFFAAFAGFSQSHINNQMHSDKVSSIAMSESAYDSSQTFFTADEDGFIIKWEDDDLGEHYQVSDFQVKAVVKNPKANLIAVSETDGFKQNRVSVIDWTNFKRLYSIYYTDTVSAVAFSAQGTFLMVGTYSAGSTFVYKADTGELLKHVDDVPGMISMIKTGTSEKSMILYSSTGAIVYYDLIKYKVMARYSTERLLTQTVVFGTGDKNNKYLAGVKDNTIYFIDAMSGKTLSTYASTKPLLCLSNTKTEEGLYFVYPTSSGYSVRLITNETLAGIYDKTIKTITTTFIKSFTGLKSKETITSVNKNMDTIVIGTSLGNVYKISDQAEEAVAKAQILTTSIYDKIYDAACVGEDFYIATASGIYKSSFDDKTLTKVIANQGWTNLTRYEDKLLLWAKGTKKTVQQLDLETGTVKALFTPTSTLQSMHIYENRIVYTQGKTTVSIYDAKNKTVRTAYTGTGIEDALLVNSTDVYIAKTKTGYTDSALMKVNRSTMETVPLRIKGDLMLSLNFDPSVEEQVIYGVMITNEDRYSSSQLAAYTLSDKSLTNLFSINEEDSTSAFCTLVGDKLYSNIGKDQFQACSLNDYQQSVFSRNYSIPLKLDSSEQRIVVINYDGSLTWYNKNSQMLLGTWYLKNDGTWIEF